MRPSHPNARRGPKVGGREARAWFISRVSRPPIWGPRLTAIVALASIVVMSTGCLGEPEIEDRWTRVDIAGSNLSALQPVQAGSSIPVQVAADVTYRRILTGFAVAELRASTTFTAGNLQITPNADRLRMAADIDRLLATSVSVGRATRAITGWDHLIQRIDFAFTGSIPGSVTDSTGSGPVAGLFLVCYLGSGEEVETASGQDSVIVTPFASNVYQVLPVGLPLSVTP